MFIKRNFKNSGFLSAALLVSFLILGGGRSLQAKIIEPESLLFQILQNNRDIFQMVMETHVRVFDPDAFGPPNKKLEGDLPPHELTDKSFAQKIIWIRDEYYLIETMESEKSLLNILVGETGGEEYFYEPRKERLFSREDISFPYLQFYTKFVPFFKTALYKWGVPYLNTQIVDRKHSSVYRLGDQKENLVVDPSSFRVLEINRQIQFKGKYLPFKITFSDWRGKKKRLPMTTRFFINSRLFKEIRVTKVRFRSIYKDKKKFLNKYSRFFPSPLLKLNVAYSR